MLRRGAEGGGGVSPKIIKIRSQFDMRRTAAEHDDHGQPMQWTTAGRDSRRPSVVKILRSCLANACRSPGSKAGPADRGRLRRCARYADCLSLLSVNIVLRPGTKLTGHIDAAAAKLHTSLSCSVRDSQLGGYRASLRTPSPCVPLTVSGLVQPWLVSGSPRCVEGVRKTRRPVVHMGRFRSIVTINVLQRPSSRAALSNGS